MKKHNYFFCLLFVFSFNSFSQNQNVVHPLQSLINLNPSFAGSNGLVRNQAYFSNTQYNDDFGNHSGNNTIYQDAADVYLKGISSGLAAYVNYNHVGIYYDYGNMTTASLSYAKYFTLFQNLKIIPSVQLGYGMIKPGESSRSPFTPFPGTQSYFSLSSGLLINYKRLYVGCSVFNINEPAIKHAYWFNYTLRRLVNAHASYNLQLGKQFLINAMFNMVIDYNGDTDERLDLNVLLFRHAIIGVGRTYKGDTYDINLGFRANYFSIQVGRSIYDPYIFNKSTTAWQLMASFNLRNKEQRKELTNFEAW